MKRLRVVTPLLMMLLVCSPSVGALTDWGTGLVTQVFDADDGFLPGQEILSAWHKYDAGMHYFRID